MQQKKNQSSARFRSATEFPKTIDGLNNNEVDILYREMRDCLVFTNRSRSQLLRRNKEHKERMQVLINQLKQEKTEIAEVYRQTVVEMENEIGSMSRYLDQLSTAFDSVSDIENPEQAHWNYLSFPSRFFKLVQAIKSIVLWWREEKTQETVKLPSAVSSSPLTPEQLQQKPQMSQDPRSIGKSLLDNES